MIKKLIPLLLLYSIVYAGTKETNSALYDIYSLESNDNNAQRIRDNFYNLDVNKVDNSSDQTIGGNKTFTGITYGIVPTGAILPYISSSTMPTGFLYCNGQAVSRTTYSALFAIIGVTFGTGDSSTTFNLPDMRGMFLRGLDNGRGLDDETYRVIGSTEVDKFQGHKHGLYFNTSGSGHTGDNDPYINSVNNYPTYQLNADSSVQLPTEYSGYNAPRYGVENRPTNIAVTYIIKY